MKKTILWLAVLLLIVGSVVFFAACAQNKGTSNGDTGQMPMNMDHNGMDHGSSPKKADAIDFDKQRNDQTSAVIDAYDQIRKALETDDKAAAAKGATGMLAELEKLNGSKLDADKRKEFDDILDNAKEHAEHIVKSEVDHQKEHFEELTGVLKDLFDIVGANNKPAG